MRVDLVIAAMRFSACACLVLAIILVMSGGRICASNKSAKACTSDVKIGITHWKDGGDYDKLRGQYAVILFSSIVFGLTLFNAILRLKRGCAALVLQKIIIVVGLIMTCVFGAVEAWYGYGWGMAPSGVTWTISTWLVATVLLYITFVINIVDLVLTIRTHSQPIDVEH